MDGTRVYQVVMELSLVKKTEATATKRSGWTALIKVTLTQAIIHAAHTHTHTLVYTPGQQD